MSSHVETNLSAVILLFVVTISFSTSSDVTIGKSECHIDAELSIASQIIQNVRRKLQSDKAYSTTPSPVERRLLNIADAPDICVNASIDAITRTLDGTTYAFKGEFYWKIWKEPFTQGIANEKPGIISSDWDGLPGNIDAALTLKNGTTFFFKGVQYWEFRNKVKIPGYPKLIHDGFPGVPDSPDAAFVWTGDNMTYFFKGSEYFRFTEDGLMLNKSLPIKGIKGLPPYIDAALQWDNGMAYIFKCHVYYRLHNVYFQVDTALQYPGDTSKGWYRCDDK